MTPELPVLSELPKLAAMPSLANKAFIAGFFSPAFLFTAAMLFLFSDCAPAAAIFQAILTKTNLEYLIYLFLGIWMLSLILTMINHAQYQLLEGYRWPISRMKWLTLRQQRRLAANYDRLKQLSDEWERTGENFPAERRRQFSRLEMELVKNFPVLEFPPDESLMLPTRFGNAIRAFEAYSARIYNADSISLWPHLAWVLSKEALGGIEDARAQVNFYMNISCLAAFVGLAAIARLVASALGAQPVWIDYARLTNSTNMFYALFVLGGGAISFVAYRWSIQKIYDWGVLFKAAFDCYLPALAKQLGYELPNLDSDERNFWRAVSQRATFHRPMPAGKWVRTAAEVADRSAPGRQSNFSPDPTMPTA